MLWIAFTILAACAGALVALPFLRTRPNEAAPTMPLDVYKSQLDTLGRDEKAGELDPGAAEELRAEIERRILTAPTETPQIAKASARFDRATAAIVVGIVVLGSALLYAATGSPNTQSAARAAASVGADGATLPDVDTMIESLRARLEASPDDADGWRMLGWSYFETGRFDQAVEAYRRAIALSPGEGSYGSALAEALTQANGGTISPEALLLFQRAGNDDERARFHLALAKMQQGDARGAVNDWIAGVRAAAPDSQWAPRMRAEAEAAAGRIGMDIAGRLPPAPAAQAATVAAPALSPDVIAQAQQAPPEAQQQMIAGMVEGLEQRLTQNPRDADRWVMLMRSRMVLGQPDRARAALQTALRTFNGDGATQDRLRAAAAALDVPGA